MTTAGGDAPAPAKRRLKQRDKIMLGIGGVVVALLLLIDCSGDDPYLADEIVDELDGDPVEAAEQEPESPVTTVVDEEASDAAGDGSDPVVGSPSGADGSAAGGGTSTGATSGGGSVGTESPGEGTSGGGNFDGGPSGDGATTGGESTDDGSSSGTGDDDPDGTTTGGPSDAGTDPTIGGTDGSTGDATTGGSTTGDGSTGGATTGGATTGGSTTGDGSTGGATTGGGTTGGGTTGGGTTGGSTGGDTGSGTTGGSTTGGGSTGGGATGGGGDSTGGGSDGSGGGGETPDGLVYQRVSVTRPPGALVLTQVCGDFGALGEAPAVDGFPGYPVPIDALAKVLGGSGEPSAVCDLDLGEPSVVVDGPISGRYFAASGRLHQITVVDTRSGDVGWSVVAVQGDLTGEGSSLVDGNLVGWVPQVTSSTGDTGATGYVQFVEAGPRVVPGTGVATGGPGGLADGRTLASADPGRGLGVARLDAHVQVLLPVELPSGTYVGVVSLTVI